MFFVGRIPQSIGGLLDRLQTLSSRLMAGYKAESEPRIFTKDSQILDSFSCEQLGRIRSGMVTVMSKGVAVACLEAGDLVGVSRVFGLPHSQLKVDEPVQIELMQRDHFMQFVSSNPERQHRWSNYLLTLSALYQEMLVHFHVPTQGSTPKGFQQISAGEVIIREGEVADTVYQLMSGNADVTVNKVTVGEVLEGEIFGAMAVFTREARNATVIAREDCQLLAIPKHQFVDLIRAQPETAITLLDNMSRRIKSLNEQVLRQTLCIA